MQALRSSALAIAVVGVSILGCVSLGSIETEIEQSDAYLDERGEAPVQMISTLIEGKNVFLPATVVVTEGSGRSLSIFNTTEIPHGFRIPSLGVETILQPQQETLVSLPTLAGGRIHEIVCHLHPPHREATLLVLHGRIDNPG